jgi:transcriptional regulator GlxA family with amidase domain
VHLMSISEPLSGPPSVTAERPLLIGIAIFENVLMLDVAGPWEVLSTWAGVWPGDNVEVQLVGARAEPVPCQRGGWLAPDVIWDAAEEFDIVIYPGGHGVKDHLGDPEVQERLRGLAARAEIMVALCTGALALADAGLLDNRPATTHWASLEILSTLGHGIDVRPKARIVDDGDVVTAAGVSAGIDLGLHLVSRLKSMERAAEVRRMIDYYPAPLSPGLTPSEVTSTSEYLGDTA